jgi:hypothetical protein
METFAHSREYERGVRQLLWQERCPPPRSSNPSGLSSLICGHAARQPLPCQCHAAEAPLDAAPESSDPVAMPDHLDLVVLFYERAQRRSVVDRAEYPVRPFHCGVTKALRQCCSLREQRPRPVPIRDRRGETAGLVRLDELYQRIMRACANRRSRHVGRRSHDRDPCPRPSG